MKEKLTIGWIGTGTMGTPMVSNLLKKGFEVYVYNRTSQKAAPLEAKGAKAVGSPKDLWKTCDAVFLMVTNAQACEAIFTEKDGLLDGEALAGKTIINSSTIGADSAQQLASLAKGKGLAYMDAPVSGSAGAAAEATLLFLVGGTQQQFERFAPVWDAMGKKNYLLGPVGAGNKAKLAINYLIAINYLAIGETVRFAEKMAIAPEEMMDIINNSGAGNVTSRIKTQPIVHNDFSAIAFALDNMLKDVRLASDAGNDMPLMKGLKSAYADASAKGYGAKDVMEILTYLRKDYQPQ